MQEPWLIAVMGPTATGKSDLAESLAEELSAKLINADAFQVYCGMDIGTSKPIERDRYELIDIKKPNEGFGVGEWLPLAHGLIEKSYLAKQHVIVVGGTGLYIRALFEEYSDMVESPDTELRATLVRRIEEEGLESLFDELKRRAPEIAAQIDPQNPSRVRRSLERLESSKLPTRHLPNFRRKKLAISHDTQELRKKIESRVGLMMQNGWLEEVETLRKSGFGPGDPGFRALGYSVLWEHLAGTIALNDAVHTIVGDTQRYAKRQRSWLRSEPHTVAIEGQDPGSLLIAALEKLAL